MSADDDSPAPNADETARIRSIYQRKAATYDRASGDGGRAIGDGRAWLASMARGDTLEVGIGTGRTLPWYDDGIRLTGLELSSAMLAIARERAVTLRRPVELTLGDATALPFADASFDTVSFCLVLCTIPDDARAFAEAVRVLRPGGRIVAFEHTRSPNRLVRLVERGMQPFTLRFDGDHMLRDPLDHVVEHGLEVAYLERRFLGIMERLVAAKPIDRSGTSPGATDPR
ncbi:MAG TPA: class I SAM-dependent methyltransferase [Candidatus Limnocylindrales bacterium]|nr:class I SAM-dependent methyltransferase [Candidatus Limnocylindrales bacterium]